MHPDYSFATDDMTQNWKAWFRHPTPINLQRFLVPQEHDGIECQLLTTKQTTIRTFTLDSTLNLNTLTLQTKKMIFNNVHSLVSGHPHIHSQSVTCSAHWSNSATWICGSIGYSLRSQWKSNKNRSQRDVWWLKSRSECKTVHKQQWQISKKNPRSNITPLADWSLPVSVGRSRPPSDTN